MAAEVINVPPESLDQSPSASAAPPPDAAPPDDDLPAPPLPPPPRRRDRRDDRDFDRHPNRGRGSDYYDRERDFKRRRSPSPGYRDRRYSPPPPSRRSPPPYKRSRRGSPRGYGPDDSGFGYDYFGGYERGVGGRTGYGDEKSYGRLAHRSAGGYHNGISAMTFVDIRSLLLFSAIFRVILIVYGEWQDAHMEVRYTDVDYLVFSDAAALMAAGDSPYKRTTYRYSPLLAFLLIPNSFIHHSWGKFIFSASDILVGYFIYYILKLRKVPENLCNYSVMTWLFNPFTFTIGTRGNCEPIVCAVILWIIMCLMKGNVLQSAFWYGLIVHFRIYPIIYSIPIILVLDPNFFPSDQKPVLRNWNAVQGERPKDGNGWHNLHNLFRNIFTRNRLLFGLVSGLVFLLCTGLFFCLYEWEFLHEALLYHLTRTDPRHNFSIYFYHIYLHYGHDTSVMEKLISFLPQFLVQLVLIFYFAQDFPFCFFVQTVAFVAFNKVITAQYFVWFFCLLPLILPWSKMKLRWEGLSCILLWIGAQTHWLMWGYLLEFKGKNVFLQLWVAGLLFLAANIFVIVFIIHHHKYASVFKASNANSKNAAKLK